MQPKRMMALLYATSPAGCGFVAASGCSALVSATMQGGGGRRGDGATTERAATRTDLSVLCRGDARIAARYRGRVSRCRRRSAARARYRAQIAHRARRARVAAGNPLIAWGYLGSALRPGSN